MNIPIEDQYPSTGDLRLFPIAGAQDDLTLGILYGGRERIVKHHSTTHYIRHNARGVIIETCAIGSILAADGIDRHDLADDEIGALIENRLSAGAKEAIALLNAEAVRQFPEAADYSAWNGPFEYVNQSLFEDEEDAERSAKEAILNIYDEVIKARGGEVPA